MIETDGREYLNFKKYKMKSFNPNIKHLRIKENSLIVKLAEYDETDEVMVVSVSDEFNAKTPDQVDVADAKILQSSKQIQVQLDVKHQKEYTQHIWCREGEQLAEDGSNAFFLTTDARWNEEELAIASDHELPDPDGYFIGTFVPMTNYLNDITGCRILLKEVRGELFPGGEITMFLNTPEYSFLQKITGKTLTDEGEIDFKQKTHFLKNDQNVAQTKVVPLGFQGDGRINIYMPWMDTKRIMDHQDIYYLDNQKGADMLKKWVIRRTTCTDQLANTLLLTYEACTKVTQSFLNDFNNYRIKQTTYDGWSQDQKNKYHVGDIMPGQTIGGIEAMTLANQKTISAANDRIIDKWRASHPEWQEKNTLDWKLYVCLQKLLTACSTHCVTRFSVEADMTEKHRYYLPYYLTVSLPVDPDTAFKYGVEHKIKSAWYDNATPYKEKVDLRLSTPYVADLEDTEVEPMLPETLVAEDLNKIAGSLTKGTTDYLKYIVHTPNDHVDSVSTSSITGQLSDNNPNLGVVTGGTKTITKKIPTTRWQWNAFQPVEHVRYGNTYIIPNNGWDIVTRVLGLDAMLPKDSLQWRMYWTVTNDAGDDRLALYTKNPWWEITPKVVGGDITWDSSAIDLTNTNVKYVYDNGMKTEAEKFLYTKDKLEENILHSLGFKSKPTGWTFKATPEVVVAPKQWQKVDNLKKGPPYDDSEQDVTVYRWRDIEASWTVTQIASNHDVTSQPLVFDKVEWTDRRRLLTGETSGLDIELSSTRTEIKYTDITELYLTGIWLDKLDISFSIPNIVGVNKRTLDFNLETDAKYDEKISSVRILF